MEAGGSVIHISSRRTVEYVAHFKHVGDDVEFRVFGVDSSRESLLAVAAAMERSVETLRLRCAAMPISVESP